jgi:hypothetical protein
MIYTSYFAKIKNITVSDNLISIARKTPEGIKIKEFKLLAPSWDILSQYKNNGGNEDLYTRRFTSEILSNLNPILVVKELGLNPVLLCYERSDRFCHRFIVAKWFNAAGYETKEL